MRSSDAETALLNVAFKKLAGGTGQCAPHAVPLPKIATATARLGFHTVCINFALTVAQPGCA
jgi:hypothetical protein